MTRHDITSCADWSDVNETKKMTEQVVLHMTRHDITSCTVFDKT